MKIKFNTFNLIIGISFILAFICLMVSYATYFMFYPSMVFFEAGFVMLSVRLIQAYAKSQKEIEERQEVIVMQLAEGEDGETYVMQDKKKEKKLRRKRRSQRFDRLLPSIFSIGVAILIAYMFISSIITH